MKKIIPLCIGIALLSQSVCGGIALAVEDQHIVKQTVSNGPDVTPPTTPTNLVATAVSTSQINLSWDASSDAFGVIAYHVFRDSIFIATSTGITYSDTGLTASTLYAYTVTAFDPSYNESAHSATSSATTFSVTPPTPPSGGGGGSSGSLVLELKNLVVVPTTNSAVIQFDATLPVQAVVSWGETPDYESGSLSRPLFQTHHAFTIEGLTPGTTYYFRIQLTDGYGRNRVLENQTFTTLSLPVQPANVLNFQATPDDKKILLTWDNPFVDFDEIRIVRSDQFFPSDPENGDIIYEGRGDSFPDTDVVPGVTYYYAAFVRDEFGDFSSGSLASARLVGEGETPTIIDFFKEIVELPASLIHPLLQKLSILDIDFYQDGVKLDVHDGKVSVKGDRNLLVSIQYDKLPEVLKTIVVTLRDPEDSSKTFSFLLRVNKDKTAYEALVAPLEREGIYSFGVSILDHKHQGLRKIAGVIEAFLPDLQFEKGNNFFDNAISGEKSVLWFLIFILLLIIAALLMLNRKKKSSESEKHVPVQ